MRRALRREGGHRRQNRRLPAPARARSHGSYPPAPPLALPYPRSVPHTRGSRRDGDIEMGISTAFFSLSPSVSPRLRNAAAGLSGVVARRLGRAPGGVGFGPQTLGSRSRGAAVPPRRWRARARWRALPGSLPSALNTGSGHRKRGASPGPALPQETLTFPGQEVAAKYKANPRGCSPGRPRIRFLSVPPSRSQSRKKKKGRSRGGGPRPLPAREHLKTCTPENVHT